MLIYNKITNLIDLHKSFKKILTVDKKNQLLKTVADLITDLTVPINPYNHVQACKELQKQLIFVQVL